MAPKRGETIEQKAARHAKQSQIFREQADFTIVVGALKRRPDVVPHIKETLRTLGVLPPEGLASSPIKTDSPMKTEDPDKDDNPSGDEAQVTTKEQEDHDSGADGNAFGVADAMGGKQDTRWDKNVRNYGQVGVALQREALGEAEPAIFTNSNLNLAVKRGGRAQSQRRLAEFVEMMTGKDGTTPIPQEFRSSTDYVQHVSTLNVEMGRRCRDLLVYTDEEQQWIGQGLFDTIKHESTVEVKNKFTGQQGQMKANTKLDFWIKNPFSETSATLRCYQSDMIESVAAILARGNSEVQKGPQHVKPNREEQAGPKRAKKTHVKQEPADHDAHTNPASAPVRRITEKSSASVVKGNAGSDATASRDKVQRQLEFKPRRNV